MSKQGGEKNASSQLVGSNVTGSTIREENLEDFNPEWCQKLLNDPSYDQASPYT